MDCNQQTDQVLCHFDFTNVARQDYYLLKHETPLEGLYSAFLTVKHGDKVIEYQGYTPHRLPATKSSYVLIPAGGTVSSSTLPLTRAYKLSTDGIYSIQYTGRLNYIQAAMMNWIDDQELALNHVTRRVKASTYVMVTDARNLQLLESEEQMKSLNWKGDNADEVPQARVATKCKTPTFEGPFPPNNIAALHEGICEDIGCVIGSLNNVNNIFTKWFRSGSLGFVQRMFTDIETGFLDNNHKYVYVENDKKVCQPGWASSTSQGPQKGSMDRIVNICPPFFNLPEYCIGTARETKEMVLIHEATHSYGGTDDFEYSIKGCQSLIADGRAPMNANNYALYYCEVVNHPVPDHPDPLPDQNNGGKKNKDCVIL